MPRRRAIDTTTTGGPSTEDVLEGLDMDFEDDDTSSLGHLMLREQRQTLHYLRLIEHEMPKLVGERVFL
jgi:small subunit ribosomal protein S35